MPFIVFGKECQKAHWPKHKRQCQAEVSFREAGSQLKEDPRMLVAGLQCDETSGLRLLTQDIEKPVLQVVKDVRKWILIHRNIIDWATCQALQFDIHPEKVDTHHLDIHVSYRPASSPSGPKLKKHEIFTLISSSCRPLPPDYWDPDNDLNQAMIRDRQDTLAVGGVGISQYRVRVEGTVLPGITEGSRIPAIPIERVLVTNWTDIFKEIVEGRRDMGLLIGIWGIKKWLVRSDPKGPKYAVVTLDLSSGELKGDVRSTKDPSFHGSLPTYTPKSR
ncbi:hypothetical protein JAAARDRAFT_671383 [Jaapia argillacea MUCL 33604]|uniref:MYND-type domain-containing protein n=1 Tax=Jaapia argillacea MUCL 33604 TaxID=933084 RepID=A0A067PXD1_9AGAM|nr:hypothetical protein JAAARDRAFT_671383 [Jaapia argillacea MUCL 33604]